MLLCNLGREDENVETRFVHQSKSPTYTVDHLLPPSQPVQYARDQVPTAPDAVMIPPYRLLLLPLPATDSSQPQKAKAEKEFPVNLRGIRHSPADWRWTFVHRFQKPAFVYDDQTERRHRDFAGRVTHKPMSDRYLHHLDGRLRNLIVQCSDELYQAPGNTTWQRTYVRNVAPLKIRLATWVIDYSYDPENWNDWWIMFLRALPAAIAMTFLVGWPRRDCLRHAMDLGQWLTRMPPRTGL